MSRSPTAYRHFAFIRFNTDPVVPGRGSGIFLHASTGRPTLGCVALAATEPAHDPALAPARAEPLIAIGTQVSSHSSELRETRPPSSRLPFIIRAARSTVCGK